MFFIKRISIIILTVLFVFGCSKTRDTNGTAQKKIFKIGVLDYVNSLYTEEAERGIIEGLKENQLTSDCFLDIKNAQGDIAVLNSAADLFAQSDYDLIFAITPPAIQVSLKKIKDKPVVFTNAGNPVEAGTGISYEDHISNITGISTTPDFEAAVKIIKNFFPEAKRIGTLFTPTEVDSVLYLEKFTEVLKKNSMEIVTCPIASPSDIGDASNALCEKNIDAYCQIIDNLTGSAFGAISVSAKKKKIPLFCFGSQNVKKGLALAAASRDYYDCGKETVKIAVRILQGENPKHIPISLTEKTKIVLNKKAAEDLNIKLTDENTKIFGEIY